MKTVIILCLAGLFPLGSLEAQINFSGANQYRGLQNQRPSDWNQSSGSTNANVPSAAEIEAQQRRATATAKNQQGLSAYDKGDFATAERLFQTSLDSESDPVVLNNLAMARHGLGNIAFNKGDFKTALSYYQNAFDIQKGLKSPAYADEVRRELKLAKERLREDEEREAEEQRQQNQERQDKAAVNNIQQIVQRYSPTAPTAAAPPPPTAISTSTSNGMDFDNVEGKNSSGDKNAALDFNSFKAPPSQPGVVVDSNVVDARNIPSGLPSGLEKSITGVFQDATPDAQTRIRKGFLAVMTKDWNVAAAYFDDALNHDPGNPALVSFVKSFHQAMNAPAAAPTSAKSQKAVQHSGADAAKEDANLRGWWVPRHAGDTPESDPNWREHARFNREFFDQILANDPEWWQFK